MGTQVVSNGRPLPQVKVKVVDESGEECPPGHIGEIFIQSDGVSDGYIGDPDLTAQSFRDSWYRSGDAGFFDDGELFITGRVKDMIIVRGANLYAEDVEAVVHGVLPSVTCCAFGVRGASSEEVVLSLESLDGELTDDDVTAARTAVWRALGVSVEDVMRIAPGETPRTDTGKLQRHVLKRRYESEASKA
jgi:acyl-CoA synthetase (AMP-forming)/AMP-acid ligase II